jgi:mannose-1-phosphate guanylyltransferase
MAADGEIFQMKLPGFWMDVGQPKDFLGGTALLLEHYRKAELNPLRHGDNIVGNVLIVLVCMIICKDESAEIDNSCVIGPNVVIG